MKLVIVGGVAGGASAAARARRLSESAEIVVFERGPDVSFANCGLPYYLGGTIDDRDHLILMTPAHFRERFALEIRTRSEVIAIDRAARTVKAKNLASGETYDESYDALILAPGAAPLRPPIPGIDLPGVFTLRDLSDVDRIKARMRSGGKRAVIVGAGFIGLELAENFVHQGLDTTLVELQDQVMPPFDKEMTVPILAELAQNGVKLLLSRSAKAFEAKDDAISVVLSDGGTIDADLVILGVGVRPENKLAVEAGLEVGPRGGIRTDDRMRTSDPNIYAVGDAVETTDFVLGGPTQVPLGGPANRQGRIAADNVFGRDSRYRGTQGTAVVGAFDLTAAMTGASEKTLKRVSKSYARAYVHPTNHAGYYPGAQRMHLKLLYEPGTGRILGAQAVGGSGVDKRIDVIAMAIQAGLTVEDLEEAELCYAPQYGSAKDAVNMAGFVAAGKLRGDQPQAEIDAILALPEAERPLILDVRSPREFAGGAIPGAVNIPIDVLRDRLAELPKDRLIACYCQVGQRGYLATRVLVQCGYEAANIDGGFETYRLFFPD
jgi:NADPH-dependent 2,4-dienoyl-CoA reductase/sulfur reductase-like enzyme/rhodanese-related sulfurtransferase